MARRVAAQKAHLDRVASLDCVACGATGVTVHHVKVTLAQARIDELSCPLCPRCHQGSKDSAHGGGSFLTPCELLARTFRALADAERVEVWP